MLNTLTEINNSMTYCHKSKNQFLLQVGQFLKKKEKEVNFYFILFLQYTIRSLYSAEFLLESFGFRTMLIVQTLLCTLYIVCVFFFTDYNMCTLCTVQFYNYICTQSTHQFYNFHQLGNQALPMLSKVTPAVYPHLNDFTRKLNFRYKSRPTLLRIPKLRTFLWVS